MDDLLKHYLQNINDNIMEIKKDNKIQSEALVRMETSLSNHRTELKTFNNKKIDFKKWWSRLLLTIPVTLLVGILMIFLKGCYYV